MLTTRCYSFVLGIAACTLFVFGCSKTNTTPIASPPPASQPAVGGHDHSGHDHGEHAADSDVAKAMASLAAADRVAAEKQKICPVSDEPLGSMGKPIKVSVEGRDVFICCDGCTDSLKGDPAKYLAKLPQ